MQNATNTEASGRGASPARARTGRGRHLCVHAAFAAVVLFAWAQGRDDGAAARSGFEGVRFREVAKELGVDFKHRPTSVHESVAHIEPQIASTGAAVAVVDVDRDGWPDLYATTSEAGASNALYVNRGDGTFDERADQAGLARVNRAGESCSMGSVWADYDGDGRQDVFIYAWGRCRLFRNSEGLRFEDVTAAAGLEMWINSNAATWFDYDRDGWLDLLVTGYFDEAHDLWNLTTTKIMHDSLEFASNGGRNRLFRNRGDGSFEEVTEATGVGSRRWTYAAVAADFDRDGWPDLYIANDYGSEELLFNRGGTHFERAELLGLELHSKSGMCVALGNVLNNGALAVYVTNISKRGYLFQGNNLRLSRVAEGRGFVQLGSGAVIDCGWAWGAQFCDLDNDGWQDLFVVNGFISNSRERDYWYQMSKVGVGAGGIVADAANWPPIGDRSLSGFERTRVLLHVAERAARYVDVSEQVGVVDEHDGRAVAVADLDRDGDLDVVVANQNGPLLIWRNESTLDRRWLAFELEGRGPNGSAVGAEVTVQSTVGTQVQIVATFCGFSSQNDLRLHFGLGDEAGPVHVSVQWPSGLREERDIVALDRLHRLVEGAP